MVKKFTVHSSRLVVLTKHVLSPTHVMFTWKCWLKHFISYSVQHKSCSLPYVDSNTLFHTQSSTSLVHFRMLTQTLYFILSRAQVILTSVCWLKHIILHEQVSKPCKIYGIYADHVIFRWLSPHTLICIRKNTLSCSLAAKFWVQNYFYQRYFW